MIIYNADVDGRLYTLRLRFGYISCMKSQDGVVDSQTAQLLGIGMDTISDDGYFPYHELIDARGLKLLPGFIDLHVHFRDPGLTKKEDLLSGSKAAAAGGFTTVVMMPNTIPVIDNADLLYRQNQIMQEIGLVNGLYAGAITKGLEGQELTPIEELNSVDTKAQNLLGHGVAGLSDDGKNVDNEQMMRDAMNIAKRLDLLVMDHTEDNQLDAGYINDGRVSSELDIAGIPNVKESNIVARDIRLAEETGARVHIQHVSTRESVALIRDAKARGLNITSETGPHYFALTDEAILVQGADAKMNPPLRNDDDKLAVINGLKDGTIDCIATDHAPHTITDKWGEVSKHAYGKFNASEKKDVLETSAFGIVGLETAFAISYTYLVKPGHLTLEQLVDKLSKNPAKILGLQRGKIDGDVREGMRADLVLVDLNQAYKIDSKTFASKSRNTPFDGVDVEGKVVMTIHDGNITYRSRSK
ncbi:MAG: dihydroorotase [Clostridiales Family XIII bacterium]|jgi:dihydroorotase|nr:dihydroorotase [Clostridiales Family XIII bacterium]